MIKALIIDFDSLALSGQSGTLVTEVNQILSRSMQKVVPELTLADLQYASRLAARKAFTTQPLSGKIAEQLGAASHHYTSLIAHLNEAYFSELAEAVVLTLEFAMVVLAARDAGLTVHIAANPLLPDAALHTMLRRLGVTLDDITSITSSTHASFAKGTPEYFFELLYRNNLNRYEALFVSSDWHLGICKAAQVGLHTFWVQAGYGSVPDLSVPVSRIGSLEDAQKSLKSEWHLALGRTLKPWALGSGALRAFVPVLADLARHTDEQVLSRRISKTEWSSRDVICHLADYETEQVQKPLHRIAVEDNPFLSIDYDPLVSPEQCVDPASKQLMELFAQRRGETLRWLQSLNEAVWQKSARSSIFGPTSFTEMVYFIAEHDKLHLRQIRTAIAAAELAEF